MGQIVIFKNADFSANAISDDKIVSKLFENVLTPYDLPYSSYHAFHQFNQDVYITSIDCWMASRNISGYDNTFKIGAIQMGTSDWLVDEITCYVNPSYGTNMQNVKLSKPFLIRAGQYIALVGIIAYSTNSENTAARLISSEFFENSEGYEQSSGYLNYRWTGTLYGYYA